MDLLLVLVLVLLLVVLLVLSMNLWDPGESHLPLINPECVVHNAGYRTRALRRRPPPRPPPPPPVLRGIHTRHLERVSSPRAIIHI